MENVAVVEAQPQAAALSMDQAAPPAPAEAAVSAADIEAQYAATLRTNIDSRTTVPSTAEYRLLKPQGSTRVSFTLERDGTTGKVAVAHGSGSNLLDRQALNIVQSGRYPPFPERAFPGEARHVFVVTIEFHT
jgi:protein TonB